MYAHAGTCNVYGCMCVHMHVYTEVDMVSSLFDTLLQQSPNDLGAHKCWLAGSVSWAPRLKCRMCEFTHWAFHLPVLLTSSSKCCDFSFSLSLFSVCGRSSSHRYLLLVHPFGELGVCSQRLQWSGLEWEQAFHALEDGLFHPLVGLYLLSRYCILRRLCSFLAIIIIMNEQIQQIFMCSLLWWLISFFLFQTRKSRSLISE